MLERLAEYIVSHRWLLVPLFLGLSAFWVLVFWGQRFPQRAYGWLLAAGLLGGLLAAAQAVAGGLFLLFAGLAVLAGLCVVTQREPVYAALWFAIVVLSTAGLFLLRAAPFLAAATVIVYAGAIIVVFLFILMLAQQKGFAVYDLRFRRPIVVGVAGGVLLAALAGLIGRGSPPSPGVADSVQASGPVSQQASERASPLSLPQSGDTGGVAGLGRSLLGDYLWAIEMVGALLLVAAVAAIGIAERRGEGAA